MVSLAFYGVFTESLFDFNYTEVGNAEASHRELCTIISKLETWKEFQSIFPGIRLCIL